LCFGNEWRNPDAESSQDRRDTHGNFPALIRPASTLIAANAV
jgi:hypothetical protein